MARIDQKMANIATIDQKVTISLRIARLVNKIDQKIDEIGNKQAKINQKSAKMYHKIAKMTK